MNVCPQCQSDLLSATWDPHNGPTWYCTQCRLRLADCYFCRLATSRCDESAQHVCLNTTCKQFRSPTRRCPRCNNWSFVGENGRAACMSSYCRVTMPMSPAPADDTDPLGTPVEPAPTVPAAPIPANVASIESILDQIAAQSHFEDRYELYEKLREGGMGQVWRAYDRILRRETAIKMAQPHLVDSHQLRGQFLKEARIGAKLLHPNILPVFDLGVNRRRQIYFTMRLVHGASLRASLDAVATGCETNLVEFPLVRVVGVFVRACRGVDFAHQHGVLHLDIKPDNILISGFHEVFVIDWGLARVADEDDTQRLIDLYSARDDEGTVATVCAAAVGGRQMIGTPGYMAPEQVRGQFEQFCPATDVFGLGGVLFYLLYGRPPCRPEGQSDVGQIIAATLAPQERGRLRHGILPRGQRPKPEVLDALESLERICLKALERDPAQRYARIEDMIIELNEWAYHKAGRKWDSDGGFW